MSRYLSGRHAGLTPYTPGEQPRDIKNCVKLNTNESPFPPSPKAVLAASEAARHLELYSDPECRALIGALSRLYGVAEEQVICFNGSDELLNFALNAWCGPDCPVVFPDITYSFYETIAALNGVPFRTIPLLDDFTLDADDYVAAGGAVLIPNPNAPTGLIRPVCDIERIVRGNPEHVVIIDEAYIDFGGESCLPLIEKYPNLLVTRTFSKSRSMAGARLGCGFASAPLIADLNTLRDSFNPYNVNAMTLAAATAVVEDEDYTRLCCREIIATREKFTADLRGLGFELNDSMANFVFARHPAIGGAQLYKLLRARGILVRHFSAPRLGDYNRISIGSRGQMEFVIGQLEEILKENAHADR